MAIQGIFPIYKPKGPTSFRVISELRKITGEKRIGHAGTLDPLARGVLVVAIGREFTKKLHEAVNTEKEYIADVRLGYESTTDDDEGIKVETSQKPAANSEVESALQKFIGKIQQVPPIYSAVKVAGKRAYKSAREGKEVELKPREVEIKDIEILRYNYPDLKIRVVTGKGVYIRSLARDIGKELKTGGYLIDLERIRVGEFTKEKSVTLGEFAKNYGIKRTI